MSSPTSTKQRTASCTFTTSRRARPRWPHSQSKLGTDGWEETTVNMEAAVKDATDKWNAGKIDFQIVGDTIRYCNSRAN